MKHIPGVDMSSGSLGQGISAAVGMAISAKFQMMITEYTHFLETVRDPGRTGMGSFYVSRTQKKLDNLVVIVDNNNLQIDGRKLMKLTLHIRSTRNSRHLTSM